MVPYLRTIHHPTTIAEAAALLEKPGVHALYGGALVREIRARLAIAGAQAPQEQVAEAVDLRALGLNKVEVTGGTLRIGATATLEGVRTFCLGLDHVVARGIAAAIEDAFPLTLRNALTPGDVLTEADPDSILLTLFAALGERSRVERSGKLILARVVTLDVPEDNAGYALEKVARKPADPPIVGAVGWAEGGQVRVAVCGLEGAPALYTTGQVSTRSDYLGSAEYRTEMAKVLARRAAERAAAMAGDVGR